MWATWHALTGLAVGKKIARQNPSQFPTILYIAKSNKNNKNETINKNKPPSQTEEGRH